MEPILVAYQFPDMEMTAVYLSVSAAHALDEYVKLNVLPSVHDPLDIGLKLLLVTLRSKPPALPPVERVRVAMEWARDHGTPAEPRFVWKFDHPATFGESDYNEPDDAA